MASVFAHTQKKSELIETFKTNCQLPTNTCLEKIRNGLVVAKNVSNWLSLLVKISQFISIPL